MSGNIDTHKYCTYKIHAQIQSTAVCTYKCIRYTSLYVHISTVCAVEHTVCIHDTNMWTWRHSCIHIWSGYIHIFTLSCTNLHCNYSYQIFIQCILPTTVFNIRVSCYYETPFNVSWIVNFPFYLFINSFLAVLGSQRVWPISCQTLLNRVVTKPVLEAVGWLSES